MGVAQLSGGIFQTFFIAGHQQQIKTTRGQPFCVDGTDAGRCAGDQSSTLGFNSIHDSAPEMHGRKMSVDH
jgi:hypothetical protein